MGAGEDLGEVGRRRSMIRVNYMKKIKLLYKKNLSKLSKAQLTFKIKVHRSQCINPFKHACINGLHLKQKCLLVFYSCHVMDTAKHVSAKLHFVYRFSAEHIHAGFQPLKEM